MPPGGQNVCRAGAAEADTAGAELANANGEIGVGGEELEAAEEEDDAADAHIPEEEPGGVGTTLAGFMDFGGSDGFGEGEFGVFHHDAADEGDE